jgi:hypothetical protein
MRTVGRPGLNLIAAARVFQTVTVTVGGLYLATHSVTVTMIGTCAATAITALSSLPENVGRLPFPEAVERCARRRVRLRGNVPRNCVWSRYSRAARSGSGE